MKNILSNLALLIIIVINNLSHADESLDLSQYQGRVVYLDFWASWCGPCRQSFPWMNALHDTYKDDGLVVIGVNVDAEHDAATKFLSDYPAKFNIFFDAEGKEAEAQGVMGMPSSFLFNRKGEIVATHIGFNVKKAPLIRQEIEALLAK